MALIYTQGFDHISTDQNDAPDGWDGLRGDQFWDNFSNPTAVGTLIDHNDGKAYKMGDTSATSTCPTCGATSKIWSTGSSIVTIGIGVRAPAVYNNTSHFGFVQLLNGTTELGAVGLSSASSSELPRIAVKVGVTTYRSTQTFYPGPWYYIEFQLKYANPGWAKIRVNNVEVLNQALAVTSTTINRVVLNSRFANAGCQPYYDDFYILDSTGSAPWNDFLGPIIIHPVVPTSAGSTQSWSSTTGTHHEAIDDSGVNDGDTSYIHSNVNNAIEYFKITTPSINGTVVALKLHAAAKQQTYGPNNIVLIDKASASERESSTQVLLAEQYAYYYQHLTNLADSSSLTPANIDNAEFGVKVKRV